MPEHFGDDPEQRHETTDPVNPPNSVLRPDVRRTAVWTYVGILVVVFLIVGAAFLILSAGNRLGDGDLTDPNAVGTSGDRMPREGTPGGFNPTPDHDSTADEIEFRGAGEPPQGPMPALQSSAALTSLESARGQGDVDGRRIELQNVEVAKAGDGTLQVRDGEHTATVIVPGESPTLRAGQHADITGTIDGTGQDLRIRATRIDVR